MPTTESDTTDEKIVDKIPTGDNSVAPFKQAINTIEHKIRNLEKQKAELESYHGLHNPISKISEAIKPMYKPPVPPTAGFMDSFLKFLQTERETSPPTTGRGRGVRRQKWKQSKTTSHQSEVGSDTNGIDAVPPPITTRLSQGDSQDDALKERKRSSFDSSDDGFSSDDDSFNKKSSPGIKHEPPPKDKSGRKGRTPKADKKKARPNTPVEEQEEDEHLHRVQQQKQAPRRESSKRAAKERCIIKRLMASDDEIDETSDSGSDPAWTPQVKEDHEDDAVKPAAKKGRRGRPPGRKKTVQNTVTAEPEDAGVEAADDQSIETTKTTEETVDSDSDPSQAKENSEDDAVKSLATKGKKGRTAGQKNTDQNSDAVASEEPGVEDVDTQASETTKKAEETNDSTSDASQAKENSKDDTERLPVKKQKRGRSAGRKKDAQGSEECEEDTSNDAVETGKKDEKTSDSDSDPAWTPRARESEEDVAKPPIKKGRLAAQRKIVASEDPDVEDSDSQPIETPKKTEDTTESDSDPAWTPDVKNNLEDDVPKPSMNKRKRGRPVGRKKPVRNYEEQGDEDTDSQPIEETKRQKVSNKRETRKGRNVQPLEKNVSSQLVLHKNLPVSLPEDSLFKFVVIKSELKQEWPALWRVDGKSLLQKFEPFLQEGQILYRSISTFISWTPENKNKYITVPVRIRSQNRAETVVEFLKSEMTIVDYELLERNVKESGVYQDCFEVYIQALISQALDSNFLKEIIQEQDDYFLSRVKTIDDVTNSKKQKLLCMLRWPRPVEIAVSTWPCFNVILSTSNPEIKLCAACSSHQVSVQVLMYGQPYNSTTLEGCQPDPHLINEKNFLMCRICANRVHLFNKIAHQKYLIYVECAKRVAMKRSVDPHKDTTCILNEFLADDDWLNHLFLEARRTWGEVDSLDYNYNVRNSQIQ